MAKKIRVWDGSAWQDVAPALPYTAIHSAQASMPATGVDGQVWLDTDGTLSDTAFVPLSTIDAKGDLLVGTADNTVSRLASSGTNDQVLTVDTSTATGLKWAAPASGVPANGSATVATDEGTTSATYTDLPTSGPAVTLTTGTKALVIVSAEIYTYSNNGGWMSYDVSGATTIAASDTVALKAKVNAAFYANFSSASLVTLTAGSNTFTAKYRTDSGSTSVPKFINRRIFVINLA